MKEAIERGPGWILVTVFTVAMMGPLMAVLVGIAMLPDLGRLTEATAASMMLHVTATGSAWLGFMTLSMLRVGQPPAPAKPDEHWDTKTQMLWVLQHSNALWHGPWSGLLAHIKRLKRPPTGQKSASCTSSVTLKGRLAIRGQWLRALPNDEGRPWMPVEEALEGETVDGGVIDAPGWGVTTDGMAWSKTLMANPEARQAAETLWAQRPDADAMLIEFTPMHARVVFESHKTPTVSPKAPEAWLQALTTLFNAAKALPGCHETPTIKELEEHDPPKTPRSRLSHWVIAAALWGVISLPTFLGTLGILMLALLQSTIGR